MAKHVVRINDDSKRVADRIAKLHNMSRSEATDWLVDYAQRRLEALERDKMRREAEG